MGATSKFLSLGVVAAFALFFAVLYWHLSALNAAGAVLSSSALGQVATAKATTGASSF